MSEENNPESRPEDQGSADQPYRGDVLPPSPSYPPPYPQPSDRHQHGSRTGGVVLGAIVIIIGIVFLGQNLGWWSGSLHNWWALFILIPAIGSLSEAWRHYRANGRRFAGDVARPLVIGLLLVFVTLVFLLELDWTYVWPVVLILIGVGLLLGRWRRGTS
jgi:hypothetical protein